MTDRRYLFHAHHGGGWTKVMYFNGARAVPQTAAVTASALGASLAGTGKLSDANINLLMTGSKQMLAVLPSEPARWVRVTWGTNWTFDENRASSSPGGFCQDMSGGGAIRHFDAAADAAASYRDSANYRSSYCWDGASGGGIDLQNDASGQSHAATTGAAQQPFAMFVR